MFLETGVCDLQEVKNDRSSSIQGWNHTKTESSSACLEFFSISLTTYSHFS